MKKVLIVLYWIVAILLMAMIIVSLGYRFDEALLLGSMFLPGALAADFMYPKVSFENKAKGICDSCFITIGILMMEMLLCLIAQFFISKAKWVAQGYREMRDLAPALTNPVFLAVMIAALSVCFYLWKRWLDRKYSPKHNHITFLSERRKISLTLGEILFIESNDSITTVHAADGRLYKNLTPISQWESTLSPFFIRVHRSYLVNKDAINGMDGNTVTIGNTELPISRKYKDKVRQL